MHVAVPASILGLIQSPRVRVSVQFGAGSGTGPRPYLWPKSGSEPDSGGYPTVVVMNKAPCELDNPISGVLPGVPQTAGGYAHCG